MKEDGIRKRGNGEWRGKGEGRGKGKDKTQWEVEGNAKGRGEYLSQKMRKLDRTGLRGRKGRKGEVVAFGIGQNTRSRKGMGGGGKRDGGV